MTKEVTVCRTNDKILVEHYSESGDIGLMVLSKNMARDLATALKDFRVDLISSGSKSMMPPIRIKDRKANTGVNQHENY